MQRILWGRATSSNVMKVIWLLEELNLPYDRIDVGGSFGKTDTPEYHAMNPTGLVPTLQEDLFTLWESNSILRYLCTEYAPDSLLWPQQPRARANIDRWMDAQQTVLNRPMSAVFWGLVRTPPEKRDAAAIKAAITETARVWSMVSAQLAHHPFLAGDELTLADFPWGPHLHRWFNMAFDRPDVPYLRAWYDRLLERPAYKEYLAGPVV
ncbi:MAG TPA: glutathione S-transferase family protein [Acetobacteraceae bacterium]|jgi:glutathione S-transferase|nr:glutathione S-transferase family protein [Acetobacteraceae bacterium]